MLICAFAKAIAIVVGGAGIAELWRWALRSDVGPISTACDLVAEAYPESCGYVARTLGITQLEDDD